MVNSTFKINLIYILFFFVTFSSTGQTLEKDQIDIDLDICLEENTTNKNECLLSAIIKWDFKLNRIYTNLLKQLNPEQQAALIKSQQDCTEYKDSETAFMTHLYTDSDNVLGYSASYDKALDMLRQRVKDLQIYTDQL